MTSIGTMGPGQLGGLWPEELDDSHPQNSLWVIQAPLLLVPMCPHSRKKILAQLTCLPEAGSSGSLRQRTVTSHAFPHPKRRRVCY
jgi:hypothetical protein